MPVPRVEREISSFVRLFYRHGDATPAGTSSSRRPKSSKAYGSTALDTTVAGVPLDPPIPHIRLQEAYTTRDRQSAIRPLDPSAVTRIVYAYGSIEGALLLRQTELLAEIPSGFSETLGKRRIGQKKFRDHLLEQNGPLCAITGPQPVESLDAAHISQFSEHPVHRRNGGLLLRADMHRLFDNLLLAVDPKILRARIAPIIVERYAGLKKYDGIDLHFGDAYTPDRESITDHYKSAKAHWASIKT